MLRIRESRACTDWYVIEPTDPRAPWTNASVEGTSAEMLAIAAAIERRSFVSFTRCEVSVDRGVVSFRSPRNSIGDDDGECSLAEADALAAEIRTMLGGDRA